jgi:hypothetical protein
MARRGGEHVRQVYQVKKESDADELINILLEELLD